jgi:hypothetical protein
MENPCTANRVSIEVQYRGKNEQPTLLQLVVPVDTGHFRTGQCGTHELLNSLNPNHPLTVSVQHVTAKVGWCTPYSVGHHVFDP